MKYTVYHGTNCTFTKFNNFTSDDTNLANEIYFTSDINEAWDYAKSRTNDLGGSAKVIKAEIEINNSMPRILEDAWEHIQEYIREDGRLEEYTELYDNFYGHDTVEFAQYVSENLNEESGAEATRSVLSYDWKYDGSIDADIHFTVFDADKIKILEVIEL